MLFSEDIKKAKLNDLKKMGFSKLEAWSIDNRNFDIQDVFQKCFIVEVKDVDVINQALKDNKICFKNGLMSIQVEVEKAENSFGIYINTNVMALVSNSFKEDVAIFLWEAGLATGSIYVTDIGNYWLEIEKKDIVLDREFHVHYNFIDKEPRKEDVLSNDELKESLLEHDIFDNPQSSRTIIERFEEFQRKRRGFLN